MSSLREKLPEIALEGLFVVFAILLALAADEWRENQQNAELAERALESIETEMRSNRQELLDSRGPNLELMEGLQEAIGNGVPETDLQVRFEYSLLSTAAWQTAQVTRAVHYADYDLVQEIAQLYDLQGLFAESQRGMVEQLSGRGAEGLQDDPHRFAQLVLGRLGIVMNVETGLVAAFDTLIVRMENR
jgi:hypothetical protein